MRQKGHRVPEAKSLQLYLCARLVFKLWLLDEVRRRLRLKHCRLRAGQYLPVADSPVYPKQSPTALPRNRRQACRALPRRTSASIPGGSRAGNQASSALAPVSGSSGHRPVLDGKHGPGQAGASARRIPHSRRKNRATRRRGRTSRDNGRRSGRRVARLSGFRSGARRLGAPRER